MLQRFIQEVQDFKARVEGVGDTVQDFLNSGGTGQEFLDLLVVPDGTKRKATEIALIFNCLEAVLTRYIQLLLLSKFLIHQCLVYLCTEWQLI